MASSGILGGILDFINPNAYMRAGQGYRQIDQQGQHLDFSERMAEDRFELEKMLAMQQYNERERKMKWQRDFMHGLGRY